MVGDGRLRAGRHPRRALLPHRRVGAVAAFRRRSPRHGGALRRGDRALMQRPPRPGSATAAALFATAAIAALALALTFGLEGGWLSVGLALMVPGVAWVSTLRPLPALRWLAAVLVAVVMVRIAWEPRIVADLAPRRSSTGCSTAMAFPRPRSGSPGFCSVAAPTTSLRALPTRRRSSSPCSSSWSRSGTS